MNVKEKQIVDKFGKNSTGNSEVANPNLTFDEVTLSDGSCACEFYTFDEEVYILDDMQRDIPFIDYSEEDQELLFKSIMK